MTKPKAPTKVVVANIKAKKFTKRSQKEKQFDEFADELLKKLESDDDLIEADFSDRVDEKFQRDAARRGGLLFLSKPWKEMADAIAKDRDLAVAFADVAVCLDESISAYKGLADLLVTAQTRINLALCGREDMQAVMEEAKADLS